MKTINAHLTRGDRWTQPGGIILRERESVDECGERYAVHHFNRAPGSGEPASFFWGFYSDSYGEALTAYAEKVARCDRYTGGGALIRQGLEASTLEREAREAAEGAIVAQGGFNTGRLYGRDGQRIYWAQYADGALFFLDCDRCISGWMRREGAPEVLRADVLPAWLVRQYDAGRYELAALDRAEPPVPADFDFGNPIRI